LSKEELAKVIPEERVDRAFSRWDADENGEISEEEFDNRPPPPGMGG
jgi:Ca2+-binding EF-hand superfamily protein